MSLTTSHIALALLHRPDGVFLHELTTALGPQAPLAVWEGAADIRDRAATVVLTTHYMEEAETLCDRVGIIDHGRLIALDTVPALIRHHTGDATARLTLDRNLPADLDLATIDGVTAVQVEGRQLIVQGTGDFIQHVLSELTSRGLRAADLRTTSPGLQDVFLALTGHAMRVEEAS